MIRSFAFAVAFILGADAALAEDAKPGCGSAAPAPSATAPIQGGTSGTAPGNMGSTAWSGGTGGSYIGTSPGGPSSGSPSSHPPVAQGLDPTKPSGTNERAC